MRAIVYSETGGFRACCGLTERPVAGAWEW